MDIVRRHYPFVLSACLAAAGCMPGDLIPQGDPSGATVSTEPAKHPPAATRLYALVQTRGHRGAGNYGVTLGNAICSESGTPGMNAGALVSYVASSPDAQLSRLSLSVRRLIDARASTGRFRLQLTLVPGPGQPPYEFVLDPPSGQGYGYVKINGSETLFRIRLEGGTPDGATITANLECSREGDQ